MDKLVDRTRQFYNKAAQAYLNRNFHRVKVEILTQFLNYLPQQKKVLDIGCSVGRDLMWLKAHGVEDVYGIDFAEEMIEIAKKYVTAKFFTTDITKGLGFPSATFNGVLCLGTLGNVSKGRLARKVLKETYQILKPGGVLVITVKEGDREFLEVTNKYGVEYMNLPRRISLYRQDELNSLLSQVGFQLLKSKVYQDDNLRWVISYAKKARNKTK